MQSSVLYYEKANNYLNIRERKLDIYFRIALIVILVDRICKYVLLIVTVAAVNRLLARDRTAALPHSVAFPLLPPDSPRKKDTVDSAATVTTESMPKRASASAKPSSSKAKPVKSVVNKRVRSDSDGEEDAPATKKAKDDGDDQDQNTSVVDEPKKMVPIKF